MKKLILSLICFVIILSTQTANSITIINTDSKDISISAYENDKIEKENIFETIKLREKFKRSPESEIKSFIKKLNRYSEKNDFDKLKDLYSESYVNNDGFDKKTIFKMMEESASSYKNLTYTSIIKNIDIKNEKYASVDVYETAKGETVNPFKGIESNGLVESEIYYTDYLAKENGKWKLIASDIKEEYLKLKYGMAKNIDMEIYAPKSIPANTDYEITVKSNTFSDTMLVGSITNDKIKYPQEKVKDVLHAVKSDELTRILKSNNDNVNEYATASLAFTTASIEPESVVIKMSGIAILMSRINVLPIKKFTEEQNVKEIKNEETKTSN